MSARIRTVVVGVLLVAGCSADVVVEPAAFSAEMPTQTQPESEVSVSRGDAVAQALGQEALDALGLTPSEVCNTISRWGDGSTNAIVFLQPGATQAEVKAVGEAVAAVDPDAKYVSQEDAYREFTEDLFAADENLIALVTPDLLPASYRLSVPPEMLDTVTESFESNPTVRKVVTERPVFGAEVEAACEG